MNAFLNLRFLVSAGLALLGVAGIVIGLDYDLGSARRMGPGFFPVVLSALLMLLALVECAACLMKPEAAQPVDLRPMLAVLAAVAGFCIGMAFFGLIPAFFLTIWLATLSERGYGVLPAMVLAAVMCVVAWALFDQLLGMPIPLLRMGL